MGTRGAAGKIGAVLQPPLGGVAEVWRSLEIRSLGGNLRSDVLHGDVLAGESTYDEIDNELIDMESSGYRDVHHDGLPVTGPASWGWTADGEEFAAEHVARLNAVIDRPDADIQADVLRLLLLDSLVPATVGAEVSDGIVTLVGSVATDRERECAKYLAGLVPGVFGVIDEIRCVPLSAIAGGADDEPVKEAVIAALRASAIRDVAELTVEEPCPGTVVLSGALPRRSDHDVAIALAWSVAGVDVVDDCVHVES
jgi:osmotically-inducible protein OsmY